MTLLHDLRHKFIEGLQHEWLVVERDGKLYRILKTLQFEYGEEINWLIPYPEDWHMLKKFQAALMKAYYDARLKSLAVPAGYLAFTIRNTSQFKCTNNFILDVWEAVYRVMLIQFACSSGMKGHIYFN